MRPLAPFAAALLPLFAVRLFAQTATPEQTIGFERVDVRPGVTGNCDPAPANVSPGDGVAIVNFTVQCLSISVSGTMTVNFPTGTFNGTPGTSSLGTKVFQLTPPLQANFGLTIQSSVQSLPGWTVVANLITDYIGTPQFEACKPTGASSNCSFPYLFYDLDQATENPYLLEKLVITGPTNELIVYEVRIYFSTAKEGLDHMEVVQVTQDAQNSVTLVAGRPGVLRAFVRMSNEVKDMTATLHVTRNGADLSASPVTKKFRGPTSFDRNQTGGSVNFPLQADWTEEGATSFSIELKLPDGVQPSAAFQPKGTVTANFQAGKQNFSIGLVPFCYCLPGAFPITPSSSLMFASDALLRKLYPIVPGNIVYDQVNLPTQTWTDEIAGFDDGGVKAYLQKLYDLAFHSDYDQLIGWFGRIPGSKLAGTSDPRWNSFFGRGHVVMVEQIIYGATVTDQATIAYNAATVAHELGHNLGRRHTNSVPKRPGWCSDLDRKTDFPYSSPYIQEPGWDSGMNRVISSVEYADFMSYCGNDGIPDWISPFNYNKLFATKLLPTASAAAVLSSRASAPAGSGEDIVISGFARQDGTQARLDPVYRVPSDGTEEPSLDGGSHCLHFSGAGGVSLGDYCFQLPFLDTEFQEPLDREFFSLRVPVPAGLSRVALTSGGRELASLSSASGPPALAITAPKAGDSWSGGARTVAWTASSKDGKPLRYAVLYSTDGGTKFRPLAVDLRDTQYTFDAGQIDGGSNVKIRVMASDGLDSTTVDVGPLTVAAAPVASLSATTLDFGSAAVDQAVTRTVTLSNTGSGPLKITSAALDQPGLSIVAGQAPITIPAGSSRDVTVQWAPSSAGTLSATLKLVNNGAAGPSVVTLTGRADVATTCTFSLSAPGTSAPGAGSNGAVDVSASMASCTWTAASNAGWIAITGGTHSSGGGRVTFAVSVNPTTSPRTGTLSIAGLTYTVSQDAGPANLGGGNAVLKADGGNFTQAVGYPAGKNNVYFVVRLTPTSYPATLNAVQVYFGKRADGLSQSAPITVLAGSGTAAKLDGVSLARSSGTVTTLDAFNTYTVAPQTISSGDFVVGFAVDNPRGILPADEDVTSPSAQRSYVSVNGGSSYILLDDVRGVGGNLGIRAAVTVGK